MLTLQRNEGEIITIFPSDDLAPSLTVKKLFQNNHIIINVSKVGHYEVRLGINAPKELLIFRNELMMEDNKKSK